MNDDRYLTAKEVAKRLGLSVHTLDKRRAQGKPPTFYKIGGVIRYKPSDVEDYERQCRHVRGSYPDGTPVGEVEHDVPAETS